MGCVKMSGANDRVRWLPETTYEVFSTQATVEVLHGLSELRTRRAPCPTEKTILEENTSAIMYTRGTMS